MPPLRHVLPFAVFAVALVIPHLLSAYDLRLLVLGLISAIAVIGLSVAFGWAGLIQIGHAALIGVGAYTTALLSLRLGFGFWTALPIAIVVTGLVSFALALPLLRLKGHYLALATVGLNVTLEIVTKNWSGLTGGYDGLSGIPPIGLFGIQLETDLEYYYLVLAFLAATTLFAASLRASYLGRALIAVRDDELASGTSSVPVVRMKILAFVISGCLAAISGCLYAHYARYIAPQDFDLLRSVTLLVMLIAGGDTSVLGAIAGAIVLTFAPEWLRFLGDAYLAVFGVAVVLILVLMPGGMAQQVRRLVRRRRGAADA
jgi:branched-chain amino acid transport system permease protein